MEDTLDEELQDEVDGDSYYESESDHLECGMDYSDLEELIEIDESQMDSEEKRKQNMLSKKLADWAASNGIKEIHVSRLLRILNEDLPFLTLDGRTLLKTMRYVPTKEVPPGIGVIVNIDGIPLTKSTNNHIVCLFVILTSLKANVEY